MKRPTRWRGRCWQNPESATTGCTNRTLEARAYFRRGKFRLNETQKAEMAYRYNSYGNYRKSLMGKLNLVNSGGSYLDSVWGEICELFPEYFSPDTSEGDQPQKLKEFLDMAYARPEVNPYEQFHGMEDAAAALADELVENGGKHRAATGA